ncbi:MAG: hypothetical protein ACRDMV_25040 [Streptosporangiales bacterium]
MRKQLYPIRPTGPKGDGPNRYGCQPVAARSPVACLAVEYAQGFLRADRVRIMVQSGVHSAVKPSLRAVPRE